MIVADSDVLIDFLRNAEPAASRVADGIAAGDLTTTAVNQFELESGAHSKKQRDAVETLLAGLDVLALEPRAASEAARARRHLEAEGVGIGMADSLIAGVCLAYGCSLLTRNRKHFERVPGLSLEPLTGEELAPG